MKTIIRLVSGIFVFGLFGLFVVAGLIPAPSSDGEKAVVASAAPPAAKTVSAADIEHTAAQIAKAAVLQALRDSESARFGAVFAYESKKGPMVVCGWVNAKNGFGGFTGQKAFVVGAGYASVQMQDTTPGFAAAWNKLCAGRSYVAP